jgi:hypothetical protein
MSSVKWVLRGVSVLLVWLLLWYVLPQHDVVRITEVYNRITTVSWVNSAFYASPDSGTAEGTGSRDVRFISGAYEDGSVIVYRNEDTGWIWPPYFKYDSSNLQAVASNMKGEKWVMVTHYGWRIPILSIYPNAVRIKEVSGPDYTVFPWLNLLIIAVLFGLVFWIRAMWLQFWERMVDPAVAEVQEAGDRTRGWFRRLFGR